MSNTCLPWHEQALLQHLRTKATLPHALLIQGPAGIGKRSYAGALAAGLLCEAPVETGAACGRCAACHWLENGAHPDLRWVEPDSLSTSEDPADGEQGAETSRSKKASAMISVEQVRNVTDYIQVASHRAGPKVVVVHPAEALNPNAANALLKSLEEPPPRTYFLLVSHRPHRLLATVKSRCGHVALAKPARDEALEWMNAQQIDDAELKLAQSGGAPLLAQERDDADYWQSRRLFLGQIGAPEFDALASAEAVRDLPVAHLVEWLQKWSYDLAALAYGGALRYNPDHSATLSALARRVNALSVLRFHRETVRLQRIVTHPLNPRLFIERLLADYQLALRPRVAG